MLKYLLEDGAALAKKIVSEFRPIFASAKDFLDYQDSISSSGDRISYLDGTATVIF